MRQHSKAKVIILTLNHENLSVSEVAKRFKVSRQWVYTLQQRYIAGGYEALEPGKRGPKLAKNQTPDQIKERICSLRRLLGDQGLDNGAETIAFHLQGEGMTPPARSTINRILTQSGLVERDPKKKPKASIHRFEAAQPNQTWQSDFTHWKFADGQDVEILNWLDDRSKREDASSWNRDDACTKISDDFG